MWKVALEIRKASFIDEQALVRWSALRVIELSCLGVLGVEYGNMGEKKDKTILHLLHIQLVQ